MGILLAKREKGGNKFDDCKIGSDCYGCIFIHNNRNNLFNI